MCAILISSWVCWKPSWTPKTQLNDSSAVVWLSFWCSTRFSRKNVTLYFKLLLYTYFSYLTMSVINAERSRSSNGRGGNTQQEPHRLVKSDLSQIAVWTAHRRMTACAKIEQKNQRHISESIAIDIVLGDALTTYSRKLAEKKIVQIIMGIWQMTYRKGSGAILET